MAAVERVVLVHRLREVIAQVGFTRFESSSPDVEGELEIGVDAGPAGARRHLAAGRREPRRGDLHPVQERGDRRLAGEARGEAARRAARWPGSSAGRRTTTRASGKFFGLPYILLHSLSHLLITAVSLECGYPASSIRERIYAGQLRLRHPALHRDLRRRRHDGRAGRGRPPDRSAPQGGARPGRLCSNDPVCAQHAPENQHECRFLHGAACHGCLLIAETSCEQHNDFLDRALVISTVDGNGAEFFRQDGS